MRRSFLAFGVSFFLLTGAAPIIGAPIPHFAPSELIFTTRVQDGDLVSVEGLIVPGPPDWSDSFAKDAQSFWLADNWRPFTKEPLVRVVAPPPEGYDVAAHVYGRVHWENGKAVLYPAEVKSAWHSWEWWLANREEIERKWAEDRASGADVVLLDAPAGTITWAKMQSENDPVTLQGKVVTAVFYQPGTKTVAYFYIEEGNRSSGIKVVPSGTVSVQRPGSGPGSRRKTL